MNSESVTGYEILRKRPTKGEKKLRTYVNNTNSTNTTYADFDATEAGVRYAYRVKALRNDSTKSKRSNFAKIDLNETLTPLQGYVTSYTAEFHEPEPILYAQAGHSAPGLGTKSSVSEGDTDLPPNISTTGEIDVGGSATGTIGSGNEFDWFKVELEAGTRYQFDLEGADTGRGTQPDPWVVGIYKADSTQISNTDDDDSGVGKNSRVVFTPTATGTYYVSASEAVTGIGTYTYTLSVIVLGATGVSEADTDFGVSTSPFGKVEVGASATGTIGSADDQDLFDVELDAGKIYQFDLEGSHNGRGTLDNPLLTLLNPSATPIASSYQISSDNLNSRIVFTATETDTYWLQAAGTNHNATGTYTLSVREIGTAPAKNCDLDDEGDSSIPRPSSVRATPNMNGTVTITWNHPTRNGYSDNHYVVSHRRLWTMNGPPMGNEGKYGWQEAGTTDWANFTRVVNDNQITIDINATPGEQHAIRVHSVEEIRGAKNACSRPKTRNFWAAKQNESDPDAVTMIQNPFITEEFVFDENGNARREGRVRIEFKPVEGLQNYEIWRAGPDNTFTQVAGGSRCVELVEQGLEDGEEYVQHCKNRIHETLSLLLDVSSVQGIVFQEPVGSMKSGKTYSYIIFPVKDNVTYYGGRWDIRHITIP